MPAVLSANVQSGAAFVLQVGGQATLRNGDRIRLLALTAQGSCPAGHSECVAVSPAQAELEISGADTMRLILPLFGTTSPPRQAGAWRVRVTGVAPFPFDAADIALGRMRLTLLAQDAAR